MIVNNPFIIYPSAISSESNIYIFLFIINDRIRLSRVIPFDTGAEFLGDITQRNEKSILYENRRTHAVWQGFFVWFFKPGEEADGYTRGQFNKKPIIQDGKFNSPLV